MAPSDPEIRLDHVGIAVESIAAAEPLLALLGSERAPPAVGSAGSFRWVHYDLAGGGRLELIAPVDGTESFLTRFLDEHGPGLHHVTLEVDDLDAVVDLLAAAGVPVVDRSSWPERDLAYVSPRNPTGALFQLVEWHGSR